MADILGTAAILGGLGIGGWFLYEYLKEHGYLNGDDECEEGDIRCTDGYIEQCEEGEWVKTAISCGAGTCTPGDEYCNLTTDTVWQCDGSGEWFDTHVPCGSSPDSVTINFIAQYSVQDTGGAVVPCSGVAVTVRDGYLSTDPVVASGTTDSNGVCVLELPAGKNYYAFFYKSGFHYEAYLTYHEDKALLRVSDLQPGQVVNWDFAMHLIKPAPSNQWVVMYGPDVPSDHRLRGDCTNRCGKFCCRCGDPYIQIQVIDNFGDPWKNKPVAIRNVNYIYNNSEGHLCFSGEAWNDICEDQKLYCSIAKNTDSSGIVRLYMYPRANQDFWQDVEASVDYNDWNGTAMEAVYMFVMGFNACGYCYMSCYEKDIQFDNSECGVTDDGVVTYCDTPVVQP